MNAEKLKELKNSYHGKVPCENAVKFADENKDNEGFIFWPEETIEKMRRADPGNDLCNYIIELLKHNPEHRWAAYALRDRLHEYFSHTVKLEDALGIKRPKDRRAYFRQESIGTTGMTTKAEIVYMLRNREKNESSFDLIAKHLNRRRKNPKKDSPHYSGSTVRDIYYANYKNPAVIKEVDDWVQSIKARISEANSA